MVHDWLTANGGAERVLECLLEMLPSADLYTLIDSGKCLTPQLRQRHRIYTSYLQSLPGIGRYYRLTAPLMPNAIESFNLRAYDLVISSSWAFAHGVITPASAAHLAYVHSPMRWAWDMEDEYLEQSGLAAWMQSPAKRQLARLRRWDVQAGSRADHVVANSQFVAQRIARYWSRESTVLHPPVQLTAGIGAVRSEPHGAYISVSRLVPYKRIDVWVQAFRHVPDRRLIVVGEGPELSRLRDIAGANVQFTGRISDQQVIALMSGARGFVQASKEDFGISAIEAQGCGIPVLAYQEGGARETIRPVGTTGATGMLFGSLEPEAVAAAIVQFEQHEFNSEDCRANAQRFSPQRFREGMHSRIREIGIDLPQQSPRH